MHHTDIRRVEFNVVIGLQRIDLNQFGFDFKGFRHDFHFGDRRPKQLAQDSDNPCLFTRTGRSIEQDMWKITGIDDLPQTLIDVAMQIQLVQGRRPVFVNP